MQLMLLLWVVEMLLLWYEGWYELLLLVVVEAGHGGVDDVHRDREDDGAVVLC